MKLKRIMASILAICMVLSTMSFNVFAEGEEISALSGSGSEEYPYLINNIEELEFFRDSVNAGETKYNAEGVYVALGANIDMAGVDWSVNIGDDCNATFDGVFDGKGFTISNLTSTEIAQKGDVYICTGLFGAIYGPAQIKNLTIENATINTCDYTGNNVGVVAGFVYEGTGSIENVNVIGDINIDAPGAYGVGTIVGYAYYGNPNIVNCSVKANDGSKIVAVSGAGGIVGYGGKIDVSNSSVENLSITASGLIGGVAGLLLPGGAVNSCSVSDMALTATNDLWVNSVAVAVGSIAGMKGITVSDVEHSEVTANNTDVINLIGSTYTEKPSEVVPAVIAQIDDTYYTSYKEAVAAAEAGDTIILNADVEKTEVARDYDFEPDCALVIDLNGKTMSLNGDNLFSSDVTFKNGTIKVGPKTSTAFIWMYKDADLVLENIELIAEDATGFSIISGSATGSVSVINSTITAGDSDNSITDKSEATVIYGATSLKLENSTISATNVARGLVNVEIEADSTSTITMENNTKTALRNVSGTIDCDVTIKGCEYGVENGNDRVLTFEDNANVSISGSAEQDVFAEGNAAVFVKPDASVELGDSSEVSMYVAKANNNYYTDIQEAIKAAAPSGTVDIIADITVDEWVMFDDDLTTSDGSIITLEINGMTINGNGHTLTVNSIESAQNGGYLFSGAEKLNVNDLTIKIADGYNGGIGLKNGTISNVTFDGGKYGVIPGEGNVTITDCKFMTTGYAIYFEEERDNLVVNNNTFDVVADTYAITLRGAAKFTNNTVESGRVNLANSASGEVSGNDFGDNRLKVYNEATSNIENNTISNLVFNDNSEVKASFLYNTLSEEAHQALKDIGVIKTYEVATYEELIDALKGNNANIIMKADITATATQSSGYGVAGIVLNAGDVLDGNGYKLTINGANTTWDCAIAIKGGTVKNLTIAGAMRGIFMPGANGDAVIDNCKFEDVIYTFNSDAGSKDYSVTIKNTVLNGWTSFSNVHETVAFENCTFGEGNGYAYCRPYQATTFTGCEFNEGFEFDTSKSAANSYKFNNCTYAGAALSEDNGNMFYNGGSIIIDENPVRFVNPADAAAKINDKYFELLQDAFGAAKDGDTITLLKDFDLDTIIKNTKKVTLDLNGKTITGTDNTNKNFSLIDNCGELTVTGNGKMTLVATVNSGWGRYSAVLANNPGGKLVVENGTIEHLGGTDMAYGIDNLTNGKGTYAETIINGGTIKSTYRGIRQFLNGVEAQNILTVNGGTIEGANKSIWMQDPSKHANTGTLTVNDGATLNGDVYLTVTEGSTEWPVEVSIAASAVNGKVLSSNLPLGYEIAENNGYYGIVNTTSSGYTVTAVADKTEVRYNNGNPDSFKVDYVVTGGNVIGAMAQLEYDNTLFVCAEDSDGDGKIRMNNNSLTTDADGKTILKTLNFTVKANPATTTTYTFMAKYVQVVSDFDAAGSGTQDGFVENLNGADVTVVAQYDVTLPTDNSLAGNTYVDVNTDYAATINNFDENMIYIITYTMGGVEKTVEVTKDNVVNGGFVIEKVTGNIKFTSVTSKLNFELVLLPEAVTGYTLVMVKDGVSAGYTYNGAEMYAVERYVGLTEIVENTARETFVGSILNAKSVRAILIEGSVSETEARAAIAVSTVASTSLKANYDVNRNGAFYYNDAMTAHGCYKKQYDLAAKMAWYLSSDVNTDFVVDTSDYDDTVEAFWATVE